MVVVCVGAAVVSLLFCGRIFLGRDGGIVCVFVTPSRKIVEWIRLFDCCLLQRNCICILWGDFSCVAVVAPPKLFAGRFWRCGCRLIRIKVVGGRLLHGITHPHMVESRGPALLVEVPNTEMRETLDSII